MPHRPEQHLLEKDSRLAFEAALPRTWIMRRIEDDYGLDSTVEIFTGEGTTTGLFFNVQLKATNEPDLKTAWGSVRFSRGHADYYRSLALPVLVVLFHAPSGSLFVRWFHAYNPHVAVERNADSKTIRFQFYEQDRYVADTPEILEAGLRAFLKFRSSNLQLPLRLAVADDAELGTSLDASDVGLALRRVLSPVSGLVQVERRQPAPDDPAIFLGAERSVVALGDVASVTADHAPPEQLDADSHAADLALALSMALAYVGQANLAAQIGAAVAAESTLIVNVDVAMTLAETMFRAQRVREAVELADKLDSSDDDGRRFAGQLMLTTELAQGRRLSHDERESALTTAEARFNRSIARKDTHGAATAAYSLGNLYKRLGEASDAVHWLEVASEHDPRYLERGYFHADLAGPLFESGDHRRAAKHYERAIELGHEGINLALHADALLHVGDYATACNRLDEYLAAEPGPEGAEWRLKRAVLPLLIARGGTRHERQPAQALAHIEEMLLETLPASAIPEARARCEQALALDAGCAEAWFRLGWLLLGDAGETTEEVRGCWLAAAVLHRDLPTPWVNAAAVTAQDDEQRLLDIFYAGYRLAGNDFAQLMRDSIQAGDRFAHDRGRFVSLLETALVTVDQREQQVGFTLRLVNDDGTVYEFVFTDEDDDEPRGATASAVARRPASFQTRTRRGKSKKRRKRKG